MRNNNYQQQSFSSVLSYLLTSCSSWFSLLFAVPLLVVLISALPVYGQQAKPGKPAKPTTAPKNNAPRDQKGKPQGKQNQLKTELADLNRELASLMRRLPTDEEDIVQAIGTIKSELRLRELRWRLFERSEAVKDAPYICHPVRIELFGTYERLTDMLLSFAAFNYMVIIDDLSVKRAQKQAPLVSVEASFTILLYSLDAETREKFSFTETGDLTGQVEAARQALGQLTPRFEQRVGCWTTMKTLGRQFPRSVETILTELTLKDQKVKIAGISRLANASSQLAGLMTETQLFNSVGEEQNGPNFTLQADLIFDKAYQLWLEGTDTTDLDSLARDPFTSTFSLEQLTQGSSASYPPLDKRIAEYLEQINRSSGKRPDRTSPYLVAELLLAGLYYTPAGQGAIFKTPNEKEIYVGAGARCYNGRFIGLQQGRALFEETIVNNGKSQLTQIVKTIEASGCAVVTVPTVGKAANTLSTSESAALAKLPTGIVTLNVANIELNALLPLLHELSGYQFGYVIDQTVPRQCITINRERAPFGELLLGLLRTANLTLVEEKGVFRVLAGNQTTESQAPALATSLTLPPPAGRFGAADYPAAPVTLTVTEVELGDVLKFFTTKFGVQFALSDTAKKARITASITEQQWTKALAAMLRANRMGLLVEGERVLIVNRADLVKASTENRVKIDQ